MSEPSKNILITGGSGFIGTAVVARLVAAGYEIINIDLKRPYLRVQDRFWIEGDILDRPVLDKAFDRAAPAAVLHLAARTDTLSRHPADYRVNSEGSRAVIDAVSARPGIGRFILTSSQFVYGPHGLPKHDEDFRPHTAYGESKIIAERYLRAAAYTGCWTIIRPTNIWGPYHPRYPVEFWRVLQRGLYVHPRGADVVRSYGYVGTVADQIFAILTLPADAVHRKVLYLGDPPLKLIEWVNGFSRALVGRNVREVPYPMLRALAAAGDVVQAMTGMPAPLTSSRLRSMTESYPTPMEPTFALLGMPRRSLQDGIDETVQWLRAEVPAFRART